MCALIIHASFGRTPCAHHDGELSEMPGLNAMRTRAQKEDNGIDRRFLGGEHGNANMNSVQPAAATIPWSLTGECCRTIWIVCGQARWAYVCVCADRSVDACSTAPNTWSGVAYSRIDSVHQSPLFVHWLPSTRRHKQVYAVGSGEALLAAQSLSLYFAVCVHIPGCVPSVNP